MSKPVEVYEPFRAGLPPLGRYWRSLWARRSFINEYARSELHASHFDSIFGQLWLILNPLLLSAIYFVLIKIIAGSADSTRYAHLTSSLFLFYLVSKPWEDRPYEEDEEAFKYMNKKREEFKYLRYDKPTREPTKFINDK